MSSTWYYVDSASYGASLPCVLDVLDRCMLVDQPGRPAWWMIWWMMYSMASRESVYQKRIVQLEAVVVAGLCSSSLVVPMS
jgi:hypothetical protein